MPEFAFLLAGTRSKIGSADVRAGLKGKAVTGKKRDCMDNITIIRIVAGVLFVIVLVLLIQRRRTRVK